MMKCSNYGMELYPLGCKIFTVSSFHSKLASKYLTPQAVVARLYSSPLISPIAGLKVSA